MKSPFFTLFFTSFLFVCCNAQTTTAIKTIDAKSYAEKISSTQNPQIIDVRTPEEFETGHLDKAVNINWFDTNFASKFASYDKTKPVFVYCKVGGRSLKAANKLAEMGFTNIYDLQGGILKWDAEGLSQPDEKIIGICSQEYAELLNTDKKVLVNFYAPWCEPCKKMEPYLLQLEKDSAGKISMVRLNADENKTIMKDLKIDELPTLILYENKETKWKHAGYISEEDLKKQL